MQRTVEAMGGQLTMIATFPDQEPVILTAPLKEKARGRRRHDLAGRYPTFQRRDVGRPAPGQSSRKAMRMIYLRATL
jgi:hypothetical protein